MKKKTMLLISLIISIISLLYFVFEYYGGVRYIKLHRNTYDEYLQNYTDIQKASHNRVVLCFSTSVDRLQYIDPFINSILDQSVRVDEILLIIPYSDITNVPEKYKKVLSVHGYNKNYDDNANLICSVLTEPDANTKIILVEPYVIYPVDFVETMVSESDKNPDNIIYGSESKKVKYGILIKPKFFDDNISKYECGSSQSCSDCLDKYSNNQSSIVSCGNYYEVYGK